MRTHMRATVNYDRIYVCHTPPRVFVVGRKNKNDDDDDRRQRRHRESRECDKDIIIIIIAGSKRAGFGPWGECVRATVFANVAHVAVMGGLVGK